MLPSCRARAGRFMPTALRVPRGSDDCPRRVTGEKGRLRERGSRLPRFARLASPCSHVLDRPAPNTEERAWDCHSVSGDNFGEEARKCELGFAERRRGGGEGNFKAKGTDRMGKGRARAVTRQSGKQQKSKGCDTVFKSTY